MNIYLIERHQGNHDDYRVTPVKAFEEYYKAKEFIDVCNKDVKVMIKKMKKYDKKYSIGINAFQDKYHYHYNIIKMMDDKEYQKWCDKKDNEYNEIISTFKHEDLELADAPIVYQIKKVLLVRKDS